MYMLQHDPYGVCWRKKTFLADVVRQTAVVKTGPTSLGRNVVKSPLITYIDWLEVLDEIPQ